MRLHALAALRLGDLEGQLQHVRGSELDLLRLFGERESCMWAMSVKTTTQKQRGGLRLGAQLRGICSCDSQTSVLYGQRSSLDHCSCQERRSQP